MVGGTGAMRSPGNLTATGLAAPALHLAARGGLPPVRYPRTPPVTGEPPPRPPTAQSAGTAILPALQS
jgi:hypothetical protein